MKIKLSISAIIALIVLSFSVFVSQAAAAPITPANTQVSVQWYPKHQNYYIKVSTRVSLQGYSYYRLPALGNGFNFTPDYNTQGWYSDIIAISLNSYYAKAAYRLLKNAKKGTRTTLVAYCKSTSSCALRGNARLIKGTPKSIGLR
jgi:hypothetical protein